MLNRFWPNENDKRNDEKLLRWEGDAEILLHALENINHGSLNGRNVWEVREEFGNIELVVGARSLQDQSLLFKSKVGVSEGRIDVLLVELKDLVVRNGAGIGEIEDASEPTTSHFDGDGEQLGENGHGIGDVDDLLVLRYLRDEGTLRQIVRDGHAESECEDVGIMAQESLCDLLGVRIERTRKVGRVFLHEANAGAQRMFIIVGVDAASGVVGEIDAAKSTGVGK